MTEQSPWPVQRLAPPDPETYSPRQREIHEAIASGPRGGVRGPLAVWLHRPELAAAAQALGQYCRYDSTLEPRLSELAILTIARIWGAEFEWFAHKGHGLRAGLSDTVVEAIRRGDTPVFDREDEEVVHAFARAAHVDRQVPDALYARAIDVLGEQRVVDLVGVLGYYSLISLTLNIFRISPPDTAPKELGPDE
ncbi:carboxymuconolactone decarboxylase family protein [Pseudooceanicola sediminis]|uniref:Carboxymuconolactone decarboxylase family protein n=1 Tax=Pseudooceanicola sediminis TaxID=2211117 RepID=A0A399J0B7_9RHOB|nr:carboxymuconolactone decarboxylase family protein [Pseudooceanicola sediminis]KAA2314942.1 carboxymuconolactone decarboxylase family protein [Puniceibacterium sp. HSS470]RII37312.1 carboxymuconolactone decarboxylase family protein [Pseudooceanicola sediminis]|tara:strand:- start:14359 stop:14940 length:582 start_codon:yes stop_codon:yes gene_type:complete